MAAIVSKIFVFFASSIPCIKFSWAESKPVAIQVNMEAFVSSTC